MTQTIREAEGRNKVWIMADYGHGRRGSHKLAEWRKIELIEYLDLVALEDLDDEQADKIRERVKKFMRGYAYMATYDGRSELFGTAKEARDWCWSRDC